MITSGNSTVAALVRNILRRYDQQEAILSEDGPSMSYRDLRDRTYRLAHVLTSGLGLRKGDALGILSDNRGEFIELEFACALTGIVKVPFYARNAPAEHLYMLEDARVIAYRASRSSPPCATGWTSSVGGGVPETGSSVRRSAASYAARRF